jgi:hypothetical protein
MRACSNVTSASIYANNSVGMGMGESMDCGWEGVRGLIRQRAQKKKEEEEAAAEEELAEAEGYVMTEQEKATLASLKQQHTSAPLPE